MMRRVRGLGSAFLLLGVSVSEGHTQATTPHQAGPAIVPFLGAGGFPRPRDIESGSVEAGQMLAGAALDLPLVPRWRLVVAVARGFQPVACAGGCAPEGSLAHVALLWAPGAVRARWGLLVGPSLERSTFDGARVGGGVTGALGVLRGIGPQFTLRYHALSGSGHPRSLAGWLGLRLGG